MSEKEDIFSSKIKYDGIFSFQNFYQFCYLYIKEEMGFGIVENSYSEKIKGDSKDISIKWSGNQEVNDYFKYSITINFQIIGLKNVEIEKDGQREMTNKGSIEISIKGSLILDYNGEYETKPIMRFLRGIYNKWIIPSKIESLASKLAESCDNFLGQAKAYLALEGKR